MVTDFLMDNISFSSKTKITYKLYYMEHFLMKFGGIVLVIFCTEDFSHSWTTQCLPKPPPVYLIY